MKKRVIALLALLVCGGGYFAYSHFFNGNSEAELRLYGNVDIREVSLGFRVAGRLQSMHFEEGDSVAAGDLVAELDAQPQQHALAISQARVDETRARLELLRRGVRPQEIQQARAAVDESKAGLSNAQQEFVRQQELTEKNLSSDRLLDQARSARDQWAARLSSSQEALALAIEGFRSEEIAAATAVLAAAKAQRDQAQTHLADARLVAPSPGVVTTRVMEPGAMVAIGSPVYVLSLNSTTYVRAYVDEPSLGLVVPGAKVTVMTDTENRSYEGQVGFVSPRAEFTPKSVETAALRTDLVYRLRIVVNNADEHLRQGMPVTVVLAGA